MLMSTVPSPILAADASASPLPVAALTIRAITMITPTATSPRRGHDRLPSRSPVLVENLRTSCALSSAGGGGTGACGRWVDTGGSDGGGGTGGRVGSNDAGAAADGVRGRQASAERNGAAVSCADRADWTPGDDETEGAAGDGTARAGAGGGGTARLGRAGSVASRLTEADGPGTPGAGTPVAEGADGAAAKGADGAAAEGADGAGAAADGADGADGPVPTTPRPCSSRRVIGRCGGKEGGRSARARRAERDASTGADSSAESAVRVE